MRSPLPEHYRRLALDQMLDKRWMLLCYALAFAPTAILAGVNRNNIVGQGVLK